MNFDSYFNLKSKIADKSARVAILGLGYVGLPLLRAFWDGRHPVLGFDIDPEKIAPLLAVPDTRLIIPKVDNFCLVIRAEQTPKNAVRKAIDLLADDGVEPAGIVINGYEEQQGILGSKYRYGYGGYGGYGQYGQGYGSYGAYGSDDDDS